jgi:hypothetical protein
VRIEVTLEEMEMPEDDVLEKLNLVSTARRVANLASPLRPLSAMFFHSHVLTFLRVLFWTSAGHARFRIWGTTGDQQGQGDQTETKGCQAGRQGMRLVTYIRLMTCLTMHIDADANARGSCVPCCNSPMYVMLQIFFVYSVMLERRRYTYCERPAV